MGIFDIFKRRKDDHSNRSFVQTEPKETKKVTIVEPFAFEAERKSLEDISEKQYESLYNKFDNAYERFQDALSDVDSAFMSFDYNTRLKALQKACKEFDRCFSVVSSYWYEDDYFMVSLELTNPKKWIRSQYEGENPVNPLEVDDNPDKYHFENINFLRWLASEYVIKGEHLQELLKEKEFQLLCVELGSEEAAQEEMLYREAQARLEKEFPKFKARVKKLLIENPGILQKDIKKSINDEFWNKYIAKVLKEFELEGRINKEKCGNSYKIFWKN